MVNTPTAPAAAPLPTPVAWIGLDWGHQEHAFVLQDRAGPPTEGTLPHSAESLHAWLHDLEKRFGGQPVALAIEASRGAVIHALVQYPWLTIYPINPVTSARDRKAFTPSGASDDLPDARVLLELARDHAAKLRPLETQDPQTLQLAGLVEARRDTVDRRTQVLNQLTSLLRNYYPQALELVGELDTELAVDFLSRWPDLITLKAAKPGVVKRFYYAHHLRRPEVLAERLQFIRSAVALTTEDARVRVAVLQLRCLLDPLRAFRKHVAILDAEIKTVFATHPEAALFRDLPGAGPALAPRLCVAFGTLRSLYPDPASLQKHAGVAPVREKSGQSLWTHWRWRAPVFLRQTLVEWAGQTVRYSAWAKVYYERMQAKGKGHHAILRALAFKWIRVLWKCWQTRTPYDETRYLKQLVQRQSPNAVPV
ncbi:MAG: transposase [Verrucomicrobia bacterium]|nr:transposase [Verrucomicrobiota bacterium]